jgi:pyridoxal phosphate enzyme (YggS family)
MINKENFFSLRAETNAKNVTLIAVSKLKPVTDIQALYDLGQRDFGENYVQELVEKQPQLPDDICWHFIGHLQSNKVKYIAPFVHYIHAVDSYKLLQEINRQAEKNQRKINCLLQVHIAKEDSKFGLDEKELTDLLEFYTANKNSFQNITIRGLMGMATFTDDETIVRKEFQQLKAIFDIIKQTYFLGNEGSDTLSMGMTDDYKIAMEAGSTMVRIGRALFGMRC